MNKYLKKIVSVALAATMLVPFANYATKKTYAADETHEKTGAYLVTYFRSDLAQNGAMERTLHYAYSRDGIKWYELNSNQPVSDNLNYLLRDPYIGKGEDGKYHLVYTSPDLSATGATIPTNTMGYAESSDLINWTEADTRIDGLAYIKGDSLTVSGVTGITSSSHSWAPEWYYDNGKYYMIYSATANSTKAMPGTHFITSADTWQDLLSNDPSKVETKVLLNPYESDVDYSQIGGVPSEIDANMVIVKNGDDDYNNIKTTLGLDNSETRNIYLLYYKKENGSDVEQNKMRVYMSYSVGAIDDVDQYNANWNDTPMTPYKTEGPEVFKVGDKWHMIYDYWWAGKFGMKIVNNPADVNEWANTEECTDLRTPYRMRHAGIVQISNEELWRLINHYSEEASFDFSNAEGLSAIGKPVTESNYGTLDGTSGYTFNLDIKDDSPDVHDLYMRSVNMYIRPDNVIGSQLLYSEGNDNNGIKLSLENGNLIFTASQNGIVKNTAALYNDTRTMHNVTAVYNEGVISIYIDSKLQSSVDTGFQTKYADLPFGDNNNLMKRNPENFDIDMDSNKVYIGIDSENNNGFKGDIGKLDVYNLPLFDEDIADSYYDTKDSYAGVTGDAEDISFETLTQLIDKNSARYAKDYTTDSFASLSTALEAAKLVKSNDDPADISRAYLILLTAQTNLVYEEIKGGIGANFNESLDTINFDDLHDTGTTWVRGFLPYLKYKDGVANGSIDLDTDGRIQNLKKLKEQGYRVILTLKFDYTNLNMPTDQEGYDSELDFLETLLDKVYPYADIIVSGNEPFIESKKEERNEILINYYKEITNRIHEYASKQERELPIYIGALNQVWNPTFMETYHQNDYLQYAKETSWIKGVDVHIHHSTMDDFETSLSTVSDALRSDQKIISTEFSLVKYWENHTSETIPEIMSTKYGYDPTWKVYQYIDYVVKNREDITIEEWEDFLSNCKWYTDKQDYLLEAYNTFKQYDKFYAATYGTYIFFNPEKSFTDESDPWLFNPLYATATVQNDENGRYQPNYKMLENFQLIQQMENSDDTYVTGFTDNDGISVTAGTSIDDVIEKLPKTIKVVTNKGVQDVSVNKWECNNYENSKTGTYTFVTTSTSADSFNNSDKYQGKIVVTVLAKNEIPQITLPEPTGEDVWFKFDETVGTPTATDSVNSNVSTIFNASYLTSGVSGGCVSFDGVSNQIQFGTSSSGSTFFNKGYSQRTISFWFMPTIITGKQMIVEQGGSAAGMAVRINNGILEAAVNSNVIGNIELTPEFINSWNHVALSFDKGECKFFVNGKLVASTTLSIASINNAANPSDIASNTHGSNAFNDSLDKAQFFSGMLDDLRFYNSIVVPELTEEKAVNKIELNAVIESAEKMTESQYTQDSWAIFAEKLAAATAIAQKEDSTQDEVNAAKAELSQAQNDLVVKPVINKDALNTAIATAEALTENDYTADSWSAFKTALDAAKAVSADATQKDVDDAKATLEIAQGNLVTKPIINKDALNSAIATAEALTETDYTADSWSAFKAALDAAKAISADATQKDVDDAKTALETSQSNLATKPVVVDKSQIKNLINDSGSVEISKYTDATATEFAAKLNAARDILSKADATQEEIDAAYTGLNNAKNSLVLKPVINKTNLQDLVNACGSIETSKYTDDTAAEYAAKLNAARDILSKTDATQAKIDAAYTALNSAKNSLVLKPVVIPDPIPDTKLEVVVDSKINVIIDNSNIDNLFTQADKDSGLDLKLEVNVDKFVPTESDKDKIKDVLGDLTLGDVFNITLNKVVGSDKTLITDLGNNKVKITIDIPENLLKSGRTFKMVRIHDGKAEILNDIDSDPTTITFETNKFSTYAIAYEDAKVVPNGTTNPSTGTAVAVGVTTMVIILCGVAFILKKKIRK